MPWKFHYFFKETVILKSCIETANWLDFNVAAWVCAKNSLTQSTTITGKII